MEKQRPEVRSLASWLLAGGLCCAAVIVSGGCRRQDLMSDDAGPPTVTVSPAVEREVAEYAVLIGRTEAVNSVDIKSRVTGYLQKTLFKEGGQVKAGQVLCEIDPRTYQAQYDAAQGELEANQAKYKLAKTENDRAKALYKENPKAISLKQLDQHQAEEDAAAAAVVASKSALEVYQLNLEFTKVASPIDGRVGRYETTVGNLVTENVTTLTSVVSQDPIYAYFNVDEPTMRAALRKMFAGELPTPASRKVKVGMGMADQQGFPREGIVNFVDNTVEPSTGTITLRASFENPAHVEGGTAVRELLPGMFVRIRLPLSKPEPAVLVAEQAIGTDQGQKYVYVVDDKDTVEYRRVVLGQSQDDGLRVVSSGLKEGERVIVSGLQLVRSGVKVKAEETPMPVQKTTDAPPATAADSSNTPRQLSDGGPQERQSGEPPSQAQAPVPQLRSPAP